MAYSHDTRPEPAAVQGTGLMAQTHCTGPGPGQEQGMRLGIMGFYIMLCTVLYTPHRDRDRYKEPLLPSINEVAEMLCFYTCLPFCPWGCLPRGCTGPWSRGCIQTQSQAQGVYRPRGCIPACTEADTSQQTATAADGTHPTGMHSCFLLWPSHSLFRSRALCMSHNTTRNNRSCSPSPSQTSVNIST